MAAFFLSARGKDKLALNGYCYNLDREKNNRRYWKCDRYTKVRCTGRAVSVQDGSEVIQTAVHCHPPDEGDVEVKLQVHKMKVRAQAQSEESTDKIIRHEISMGISLEYHDKLVKKDSLKRTIQRARRRYLPEAPKSSDDNIKFTGPKSQSSAEKASQEDDNIKFTGPISQSSAEKTSQEDDNIKFTGPVSQSSAEKASQEDDNIKFTGPILQSSADKASQEELLNTNNNNKT